MLMTVTMSGPREHHLSEFSINMHLSFPIIVNENIVNLCRDLCPDTGHASPGIVHNRNCSNPFAGEFRPLQWAKSPAYRNSPGSGPDPLFGQYSREKSFSARTVSPMSSDTKALNELRPAPFFR